jgi:hypothetical protein
MVLKGDFGFALFRIFDGALRNEKPQAILCHRIEPHQVDCKLKIDSPMDFGQVAAVQKRNHESGGISEK